MDDEKKKKYDRQLRLWGEHGQARLTKGRVCLFNADATGTEILKNIILPAVGSFTIVDGNMVAPSDLGSNFFVDRQSLGQPRAQVTLALLLELNEEVRGDCLVQSPGSMIQSPSLVEMLSSYTAVVATQLDSQCRVLLGQVCWQLNIPLFLVHTNGLVGTLRCQFQEHPVVESKPETEVFDLRLSAPWDQLLTAASELDLAGMDDEHHSHVPWVFIVVQLVQQFTQEHGKRPGFGDRSWFEAALASMQRVEDQQNLVQAKANLRAALMPLSRTLSDEATEVIQAASEQCSKHPGSKFWVVAKAISDFMQNQGDGLPPLAGKIPDMVSDTASYIKLQALYQAKAEADFNLILQRVHEILTDNGCSLDTVPSSHVRLMCLNVNSLRVARTGCVSEDLKVSDPVLSEKLTSWDPADANAIWVLLFSAVDKFHAAHTRFPGGGVGSYADDVPLLKTIFNSLIADLQLAEALQGWRTAHPSIELDDLLNETCRFGNSQLHPVAAVMGGIVSQEVLKVVTEQFLPLNNFLVYNAIDSTTMTMAPPSC